MNPSEIKGAIALIISQTDYGENKAKEKLLEWNYDYMCVIKEYLNPNFNKKKEEKKISTNQKIIKGIRNYMDNIAIQYEKRKQMKKDIMETMKLEQEGKIAEKKFNEKRKREEEMKKINKLKEEEEKQKQQAYENKNDGVTLDEI